MSEKIKVVINLDRNVHTNAITEIPVDDILWISGKTNRPGCRVVLKNSITLNSIDDPTDIRKAIDATIGADNSPRKG